MSIFLRVVGGVWAILGVVNIVLSILSHGFRTSDSSTLFLGLPLLLTSNFLLYILPGLVVFRIGSAIAMKKEKQESERQSSKILEVAAIIGKCFLLAASIFSLIFVLSFFVGGNLGPIVGVVYGSIASVAFFVLFLVVGLLRARGFTRTSSYSVAFAGICLIPVVFFVGAYTFNR